MKKISAVIITYNEEKNIERCLKRLQGIADEIIVVDSFSQDRTIEICKAYNAKVYQNPFAGYSEQKSYAGQKASYDILLSLDADEALSDELKASVLNVKNNWECDAYNFNRITNFCGKWIKHSGWYPDKQLRLYDRTKGDWNGSRIHEKVELNENAKLGFLNGDLLHYSYYSIDEFVNQTNKFSNLKADELLRKGKKFSICKQIIKSCSKFFINYFLKGGILDGYYGFVISVTSSYATFVTYAKLRAKYRQNS